MAPISTQKFAIFMLALSLVEALGKSAHHRWLRVPQPPDCMASATGLHGLSHRIAESLELEPVVVRLYPNGVIKNQALHRHGTLSQPFGAGPFHFYSLD
ncbi:MAG: hypothetical protein R3C61_06640 [Bacteroidia bacterium]